MFREMMAHIRFDVVRHIFHLNLERFDQRKLETRREQELDQLNLISAQAAKTQQQAQKTESAEEKIGRNDPCPCSSGKKYKKCCGR